MGCSVHSPPRFARLSIAARSPRQPVGSVTWEKDAVMMSADQALAAENAANGPGRPADERNEAVEWLRSELSDLAEHKVVDVRKRAKEAGIAWRTVQRARQGIGAKVHRETFGGGYVWRLPKPASGPTAPP